ncbi:hypothetical protein FDZ71_00435 [bacterium]|nr:MAG: hypothetical protein FDZ71_00435 [bacterium]
MTTIRRSAMNQRQLLNAMKSAPADRLVYNPVTGATTEFLSREHVLLIIGSMHSEPAHSLSDEEILRARLVNNGTAL